MSDLPSYHIPSSDGPRRDGALARWWKGEKPDELARGMTATAKAIEESPAQKARERAWLMHARLYANMPVSSLYRMGTRSMTSPARRSDEAPGNRVNYNVVQSCIDTAAAKVSKTKTRAMFLTMGGSWSQQQRAKNLTKYCDGMAESTRFYDKSRRAFIDAGWADAGPLKVYPDTSLAEVCVDRVLPHELLVDDTEAMYGEPRAIYQRKYVPKDVLAEAFGSKKTVEGRGLFERIMRANPADPLKANGTTDVVAVYEGWHLPSGPDAEDGLHVIALDDILLLKGEWERQWFPFPAFRWNTRPVGWWGQSLAEQLVGIQIEIGRLLRTIQRCQHLVSVPRFLVEEGSSIVDQHINNEVGALVKYRGTKPEVWAASGVPGDLFGQLDRLVAKAYEMTGISQLSANSKKPEGLDAGVALREFHDIESERFSVVAQRYEEFQVEAFRQMVEAARDLYEGNPGLQVRAPGTKLLEQIAWKDVNLEEDQYVMRAFPTSILPTTPAAKLQTVQELYGSNLLTDQSPAGVWARSLLDFPDLESYLSLEQAGLEDVRRIIGQIVEEGEYDAPDEFVAPEVVITLGHNALLKGRQDKLPEQRLELLRRLVQEAQDMAEALPKPPPPGQPVDPNVAPVQVQAGMPAAPAPPPGMQAAAPPPPAMPMA